MIRLVTALDCEARPLLDRFRLRRDHSAQGFPFYRNAAGDALIVSGVGRAASAAAVAYLYARLAAEQAPAGAWLNVGVAGHAERPPGTAYLAHRISSADGARVWYPPIVIEPPCAAAAVVTVDQAETGYPQDALYEMEAAGFFPTACRFVSAELVQVFKVVSDNRTTPPTRSAAKVAALIEAGLNAVVDIAGQTAALAAELRDACPEPADFQTCLRHFRWSASERLLLRDLLRRWRLLYPGQTLPLHQFTSGGALLNWLQERLLLRL